MPLHGIVDIRGDGDIGSTINGFWYNEVYTSLYKFLRSSQAQSSGIERVAYHTGTQGNGGEGYWNEAKTTGNNAWSCWRFLSASTPFYMLMQYGGQASVAFGLSPGLPGSIDGGGNAGVGFAFAMRADGGNPWNGTLGISGTTGQDSKNSPVWTSGSSQLYVWPRSNSAGGSASTNRENTMGMPKAYSLGAYPSLNSKLHFVCDEDHILVMGDDGGDSILSFMYFGKYIPRSGSTISYPYVCLKSSAEGSSPPFTLTTYGPFTGSTSINDGGIAHPLLPQSGTRTVQISTYDDFFSINYNPNFTFAGTSASKPPYDEWPIFLSAAEGPYCNGYVGHIDWIRFVYGVEPMSTSTDGNRIFLGGATTNNAARISLPWTGSYMFGTNTSRSGSTF